MATNYPSLPQDPEADGIWAYTDTRKLPNSRYGIGLLCQLLLSNDGATMHEIYDAMIEARITNNEGKQAWNTSGKLGPPLSDQKTEIPDGNGIAMALRYGKNLKFTKKTRKYQLIAESTEADASLSLSEVPAP